MSSPQRVVPIGTAAKSGDDQLFDRFWAEVAQHQLAEWLPPEPQRILDLSTGSPALLRLMMERGHTVVHAEPAAVPLDIEPAAGHGSGQLLTVRADRRLPD